MNRLVLRSLLPTRSLLTICGRRSYKDDSEDNGVKSENKSTDQPKSNGKGGKPLPGEGKKKNWFDPDPCVEWEDAKPFSSIPGPLSLPVIYTKWMTWPLVGGFRFDDSAPLRRYLQKKYGDLVKIELGKHATIVCTFRQNDALQVILDKQSLFPKRPVLETLVHARSNIPEFRNTIGIALTNGRKWYDLRSRYTKVISPTNWTSVSEVNELVDEFVDVLDQARDIRDDVHDVLHELTRYSMEATFLMVTGVRAGCFDRNYNRDSDAQKFIDATDRSMKAVSKLFYKPGLWKYSEHLSPAYKSLKQANIQQITIIQQLWQRLLRSDKAAAWLKDVDTEEKRQEKAVILSDIMGASIDNTAVSVLSALIFLAKNPSKQWTIYNEATNVQDSSVGVLRAHPYTYACFKETLRLRPVFDSVMRNVQCDMTLHGYQIPKDTLVLVPQRELGMDRRYVTQPDSFLPERFLKDNGEVPRIGPFTSLPFGFGRRVCFGRRLADYESVAIISKIIEKFQVDIDAKDEPIYRGYSLLLPTKPVALKFIPRSRLTKACSEQMMDCSEQMMD